VGTRLQKSKDVLSATFGLAGIFGLISAMTGLAGWAWTGLRALDALVFTVALFLWLAGRYRRAPVADSARPG